MLSTQLIILNYPVILSHQPSTTVSLEIYPPLFTCSLCSLLLYDSPEVVPNECWYPLFLPFIETCFVNSYLVTKTLPFACPTANKFSGSDFGYQATHCENTENTFTCSQPGQNL